MQQPTQQSLRKVETSPEIPTRNATLQDDHSTNTHTHTTNKGTRCGLRRMPKHKKTNSGIIVTMTGPFVQVGCRTQAVVALSSAESELYAIGIGAQEGLYTYIQLHQRSNNYKIEHPHTHGQQKREEHCSKNRFLKESKTH